jgi:DNA-binding NarL/FixJ family response regulator
MKAATQSKRAAHAPRISILLVDDHPAVRHGLALLLASEHMDVCAQAGGRAEALARIKEHQPGLAIVDLSLNGENGLTLVTDLHQHNIPVLVYSMHNDAPRVQSAFAAGALGYVTKRELDRVLVQAIREVAGGRRFVSPDAAVALAESLKAPEDALAKLSIQEREIYQLLGRGESAAEIAASMQISNRTVESYCSRILVKLNLDGMHELRRHAIDHFQKPPE